MASNDILIKRSAVQGKVPTTENLQLGELAINTHDGRLFLKKDDGTEAVVDVTAFFGSPAQGITTTHIENWDEAYSWGDHRGENDDITSLIGLTGSIKTPSDIQFDITTQLEVATAGQLAWNIDDGTLDLGLNGGDVVLQIGQETLYRVQNLTGTTIPNGTLVVAAGTDGNSGKINVAPWTGAEISQRIMGITTEDIADGTLGYVTHFGKVRGIDTTGTPYGETWANGDILYAGTSGGLTKNKPEAPNSKTIVALVINTHAQVGTLFVRPTFASNLSDDELVELDNLQDGDILQYNATLGIFENQQFDVIAQVFTDNTLTGDGTEENPLSVSSISTQTLDVKKRDTTVVSVLLTSFLSNALKIDSETFRNNVAIIYNRSDESVLIPL